MKKETADKKTGILQTFSQCAVVNGEMIPGKGEDSYLYLANEDMVVTGVCDGCGGSGSKKYSVYENHTGAYLASRIVCGVVHDWFDRHASEVPDKNWTECLKSAINQMLGRYDEKGGKNTMRGSMVKNFPTTMAMTVCRQEGNAIRATYIWAGDSRGYLLDPSGLFQITKDDVKDEDAMSNLTNDGVLTNVISVSSDYVLHSRDRKQKPPFAVVNATDGCFNYLPSPMHFEFLLLDSLLESENVVQWEEQLEQILHQVSGDDHDLTVALFGYEDFAQFREKHQDRREYLYQTYIERWEDASPQEHQRMWLQYKARQVID